MTGTYIQKIVRRPCGWSYRNKGIIVKLNSEKDWRQVVWVLGGLYKELGFRVKGANAELRSEELWNLTCVLFITFLQCISIHQIILTPVENSCLSQLHESLQTRFLILSLIPCLSADIPLWNIAFLINSRYLITQEYISCWKVKINT